MKLTKKDRDAVKKTAKALLETLKHGKFVLDWRKREQSRARVKVTIETVLDGSLPQRVHRPLPPKPF
jgi:type I restriction enzyme R subunit